MAETKLHQILAVERGVRKTTNDKFTEIHHVLQKPALFTGISRTYQPLDDEGEKFPAESTRVQITVAQAIKDVEGALTNLWDLASTKDFANTLAVIDVKLGETTMLAGAPVAHLLFLERQLTDLGTFIGKLPVLDPAQTWTWSNDAAAYETPVVESHKSKKIPRVLTKAPATDKHPAQVDVWHEDIVVGNWSTIHFSGALPQQTINDMLARLQLLREAIQVARAIGNETVIEQKKTSGMLLQYIFDGTLNPIGGAMRLPVTPPTPTPSP